LHRAFAAFTYRDFKVLWFGAFLVHCSAPNRTPIHRRALLPSWQPAGRGPLRDFPYHHDRVEDLP